MKTAVRRTTVSYRQLMYMLCRSLLYVDRQALLRVLRQGVPYPQSCRARNHILSSLAFGIDPVNCMLQNGFRSAAVCLAQIDEPGPYGLDYVWVNRLLCCRQHVAHIASVLLG